MREDWASAVSSVHSHMVQCPGSTMLNDKEPSLSIIIDRHTFTDTSVCLCMCTHRCVHTQTHTHRPARFFRYAGYIHTTIHIHKYAHTKTCTKHIHRQAYSSPAFCIGDTFHYSKLLSGDVVCTLRGDMHSLQTRYTLIMHAQTTRIAFWCPCVCVSAHVCFGLACLIVSAYI